MSIIHKQVHDLVSDILTNLSDGEETQFLDYLNNYQYMFLEDEQDNNSEIEFDVTHIIKLFEQSHSIYYNKTSRIYYNYNGRDYVLFNDDHLLYLILEFITNHSQVNTLQKTSIKNKIVKLIKDNNIYETIPDSTTIQNTLNYLSQTMFTNKEYSKLFLIIIGGIILKKKIDNRVIVFTKTNLKAFLTEFNRVISIYFCNINIFNFFKFKYTQDHENSDYQKYLLPCNNINCEIIKTTKQLYVNMAIVAIYYFNRYKSVDAYIESENVSILTRSTFLYFTDDSKDKTISNFINTYIIKNEQHSLNQKDIIFLWKKYIYDNDLFVNIFPSYNDFVFHLFKRLGIEYNSSLNNNVLFGYYSLEAPYLDTFKQFWNDHFEYSSEETDLELNEILLLYNNYTKSRKGTLNEAMINLIIQCFYSDYEIIENKMIHNVKTSLWNKKKDIDYFINNNVVNINDNINSLYKKYISTKTEYVIGKIYFQKYISKLRELSKTV